MLRFSKVVAFDVDSSDSYLSVGYLNKAGENHAGFGEQSVPQSRAQLLGAGVRAESMHDAAREEDEVLDLRRRGNEVYAAGDYEGAIEVYTSALKVAPSSVLHSNRAAAYMALGWWDQALRDAKAAIRRDPTNCKAIGRHAKILIALDRLDEALQVVDDLEQLVTQVTPQDESTATQLRQQILEARDASSLHQLRSVLAKRNSEAELTSPLATRLRRRLVQALLDKCDVVDNERINRPTSQRMGALGGRSETAEVAPLAEEALRITSELLEDCPEDAELRYQRGRALARLGRRAHAEAQLLRGLQGQPDHEPCRQMVDAMQALDDAKERGNAAYIDGRVADAIDLYSMGIDRDTSCVDMRIVAALHYNRSAGYRKVGEFEKALEDINVSLALNPKWTKALYRRGILLLECGRAAEALTELKVVQRSDPTFHVDLEDWLRRAHHWLSKPVGEKNHYHAMQLPMDATKDDIRKQYRRLCLRWHPDKNPTEEGRARFADLQVAHRFLLDDVKRQAYDFGIWKDKPVRHHVKARERTRDLFPNDQSAEYAMWAEELGWGDKLFEEDDKIESVFWGEQGCPEWLRKKREEASRRRYGIHKPDLV